MVCKNKQQRALTRGIFALLLVVLMSCVLGKNAAFIERTSVYYGYDTIHSYIHPSSGLKVTWIENTDPNKSFTLGVKTPTTDSTGVNHIIEHTVFKGSKKYPLTSLFFDASSQYPHVFMNAMTASDLTMYPFCTPYEECFEALLEIYLDSVFNPLMLEQPNSFYEEAFSYNPQTGKTGGVVYNEMKGASGDINRMLFRKLREACYEGTHYSYDSGGAVEAIPTLTYDHFVKTYKQYYYPANMHIVLYGALDIEETLQTIHTYVKDRVLIDQYTQVNVTTAPLPSAQSLTYPSQQGDGYVMKAIRFKEAPTFEEEMQMDLWLMTYMMDNDSAFMKKLQGLGVREVQVIKDSDLEKPTYAIALMHLPADSLNYYEEVLDCAFKELLLIEPNEAKEQAVLAKEKRRLMDNDALSTRGIQLAERYIDEWVHETEKDIYFKQLNYIKTLDRIQDGRERLFTQMESTMIRVVPENIRETEVTTYSAHSDTEWTAIIEEMAVWKSQQPDTVLATLNLKDLILTPAKTPTVKTINGIQYMLTQSDANQYETRLYLPTGYIEQPYLPYLFLYGQMIERAASEMRPYRGEVQVDVLGVDKEEEMIPYLRVTIRPLEGESACDLWYKACAVMQEQEEDWYERQVNQFIGSFRESCNADILGVLKMMSKNSQTGAKRYSFEAEYPLYQLCQKLQKEDMPLVAKTIKDIGKRLLFTDKGAIGILASKERLKEEQKQWEAYVVQHKLENVSYTSYELIKNEKTNLYYKESAVDYLLCTYDKGKDGLDGGDYVMAAYLTNSYLQPTIRVQKGAYGAGMYATYPNTLSIYTYRDPDFKTSLSAIQAMMPIARAGLTEEALTRAKTEALSQLQKQFHLFDTEKAQVACYEKLLLSGQKLKLLTQLQKEIIQTTRETLDEKLALTAYLIHESHMSLCTDPKRMLNQ